MKKKIIVSIIAIVLLIILLYVIIIIIRGNMIFGREYCEENKRSIAAGAMLTDYTCSLCNRTYTNPDTAVPKICSSCATITGRCMHCGKLENKTYQE